MPEKQNKKQTQTKQKQKQKTKKQNKTNKQTHTQVPLNNMVTWTFEKKTMAKAFPANIYII